MIIDCILDALEGDEYSPDQFCDGVKAYRLTGGIHADNIPDAILHGDNDMSVSAICAYLSDGGYNRRICVLIELYDWTRPHKNTREKNADSVHAFLCSDIVLAVKALQKIKY